MWCSRPGALLLALPLLAACGFEPLYAPGAPAARMQGRVEIPVVDGAAGFVMRERLTEHLGAATAPTHRLEIDLELERVGVALTTDDVTTRYNVVGVADFRLVPLAGGPPVLADELRSITGYSAPVSQTSLAFASRAAEQDAERRLARLLADRIVERLAIAAGEWAP
jgi:LPS-assembly lipoprotein